MALRTLTEPSDDAKLLKLYNSGMAMSNPKVLDLDRKYAVCLISLAAGVTQPDDYAALRTAIEGVTGVTEIELLIDGQTRATLPAGKQLVAVCEVNLRIQDVPE